MLVQDGMRCRAAVVHDSCREPLAAIPVSGLARRLTEERVPVVSGMMRDIAAELTAASGGAASAPNCRPD